MYLQVIRNKFNNKVKKIDLSINVHSLVFFDCTYLLSSDMVHILQEQKITISSYNNMSREKLHGILNSILNCTL